MLSVRLFYPFGASLLLAVSSCTVGPHYQGPPETATSAKYKNASGKPWKEADPKDALSRGSWWQIFRDADLDHLENDALAANQDLKVAVAQLEESRAQLRVAAADFYPTLGLQPSFNRQRTSDTLAFQKGELVGQNPFAAPTTGTTTTSTTTSDAPLVLANQPLSRTFNTFQAPADLSWELDLFGRVRRSTEAARATAQASEADFANLQLTIAANVAIDYFTLRALDAELDILGRTIKTRKDALEIANERFQAGLTSELDVTRAQGDVATNEATVFQLQRSRDEMENSLATLLGKSASEFNMPRRPLTALPPRIPTGLPADLLERRPDIAMAERQLAAANARIGVATAAFFPQIRITGVGGYESGELSDLFKWESRIWQIGPGVTLPIFEGGRNKANLEVAKARYEQQVGMYRKQVLVAFQDVESALADIRTLAGEAEAQNRAVAAARRTLDLSQQQYQKGAINYLDVLDAQRSLLADERTSAELLGRRAQATVQLIKALGGGWH